jgi:hypothetical protein
MFHRNEKQNEAGQIQNSTSSPHNCPNKLRQVLLAQLLRAVMVLHHSHLSQSTSWPLPPNLSAVPVGPEKEIDRYDRQRSPHAK